MERRIAPSGGRRFSTVEFYSITNKGTDAFEQVDENQPFSHVHTYIHTSVHIPIPSSFIFFALNKIALNRYCIV